MSLIVLVLQNTALSVFMRMSRMSKYPMYVSSTAVVMVETIKLVASIFIYLFLGHGGLAEVVDDIKTCKNWRFTIPAGLYVVQNNLQYISANYLPAQIYQIFIQLKVVTTAILSEKVLGRRHNAMQWAAILSLFAGLSLVQLSLQGASLGGIGELSAAFWYTGVGAVLLSCFTSATAGVYAEKLVKDSSSNLWSLNIQMSFQGVVLAIAACLMKDAKSIARNGGVFFGYNSVVWTTICLQALGGLVIAFVVKSTNSVVKGFATSGSVVLSCLVSYAILRDFAFSAQFVAGAVIVCAAAIAFSLASPTLGSGGKELKKLS